MAPITITISVIPAGCKKDYSDSSNRLYTRLGYRRDLNPFEIRDEQQYIHIHIIITVMLDAFWAGCQRSR